MNTSDDVPKLKDNVISNDEINPLETSGKWSDLILPDEPFGEIQMSPKEALMTEDEVITEINKKSHSKKKKGPRSQSKINLKKSPKGKSDKEEQYPLPPGYDDPKYNVPVIWIKRRFRASDEVLRKSIKETFEKADIKGVEIVDLYIANTQGKDHAYMVLNSEEAGNNLLDGTLNVYVHTEYDDGESSDSLLIFEIADHLNPNEDQDPNVLYLWQLPTNIPAKDVEAALRERIKNLAPILNIDVRKSPNENCSGSAKIRFGCQHDTRKCIYMLNFNTFLESEIRVAYYNKDRQTTIKRIPTTRFKPTESTSKSSSSVEQKPKMNKSNFEPMTNGSQWQPVQRSKKKK